LSVLTIININLLAYCYCKSVSSLACKLVQLVSDGFCCEAALGASLVAKAENSGVTTDINQSDIHSFSYYYTEAAQHKIQ